MKKWTMPKWLEPYRESIVNTGGNSVESLMNDDGTNSNVFNNAPRALICAAVKSQVALLERLREGGLLRQPVCVDCGAQLKFDALRSDAFEVCAACSPLNQTRSKHR